MAAQTTTALMMYSSNMLCHSNYSSDRPSKCTLIAQQQLLLATACLSHLIKARGRGMAMMCRADRGRCV